MSIDEILDLTVVNNSAKDSALVIPHYTQPKGFEKNEYIHSDISLSRNLPEFTATTNTSRNIYKNSRHENNINLNRVLPSASACSNPGASRTGGMSDEISSRNYNLNHATISAGSYDGRSSMPLTQRIQELPAPFNPDKSKMNRAVANLYGTRYN